MFLDTGRSPPRFAGCPWQLVRQRYARNVERTLVGKPPAAPNRLAPVNSRATEREELSDAPSVSRHGTERSLIETVRYAGTRENKGTEGTFYFIPTGHRATRSWLSVRGFAWGLDRC